MLRSIWYLRESGDVPIDWFVIFARHSMLRRPLRIVAKQNRRQRRRYCCLQSGRPLTLMLTLSEGALTPIGQQNYNTETVTTTIDIATTIIDTTATSELHNLKTSQTRNYERSVFLETPMQTQIAKILRFVARVSTYPVTYACPWIAPCKYTKMSLNILNNSPGFTLEIALLSKRCGQAMPHLRCSHRTPSARLSNCQRHCVAWKRALLWLEHLIKVAPACSQCCLLALEPLS
jgi:hypothetical protein